jgi:peptide/nickel transport system permease protein
MAGFSRFVVNRTVQGIVTVIVVTSLIFILFEAMPGDPIARFKLDPRFSGNPGALERLEAQFGLNDPPITRYFIFMRNMFTFQFGTSYQFNRPVSDILADALPRTLALFGAATVITYLVGVVVGSRIGWKRGGVEEGSWILFSLFFYNMPSFWIGLIFIWLFAFQLGWFPLSGFQSASMADLVRKFPFLENNILAHPFDYIWHMILPLVVLVLISLAGVILLMRTSLLEVLKEDYILTARAKGLPERIVRRRHANRNAYLPVVTSFTIALAYSVGGAIILEQIFTYQGIGYYFLQAILIQDHFLAGATLFILAILVIVGNIVADLLYAWLDPRVRL